MNFRYPKSERLKRKKTIDLLFSGGKSVAKYPLRIVYVSLEAGMEFGNQTGVSVSKKYFKRAVDRNYFKRLLRESYRVNKHLLTDHLKGPYAFMIFYQSSERLSYPTINEKMVLLFEKLRNETESDHNKQDPGL